MQKIIQRILIESLSDEEKIIAALMEEKEKEYYVFAWYFQEKIIRLGYGKERSYLSYKPETIPDRFEMDKNSSLDICFPYKNLSEKEAYVLFRYEKNKMGKLGTTSISEMGLNDIYVI